MIDWLRKWFEQDDFVDDWYGWLTNQISHFAFGIAVVFVVSVAWFMIFGEFPVKVIIWPIIAAVYMAIEWLRGWSWGDSVEDTVFFAGYGAGGALLVFTEKTIGSPALEMSVMDVKPIFLIVCAHIVAGVFVRLPER